MSYNAELGIYTSPWPEVPHFPAQQVWPLLFDDNLYSWAPPASSSSSSGKSSTPQPPTSKDDRIAIKDVHSGKSITFRELRRLTLELGAGMLQGAGLKRGDVVFISIVPNIVWPIVYFACQAAGLVAACSNPLYGPQELAHVLQLTKPKLVVTDTKFLALFKQVLGSGSVPNISLALTDGHWAHSAKATWPSAADGGANSFWALQTLVDVDDERELRAILAQSGGLGPATAESMARAQGYFFSSGTTGFPKAVVLTHANVFAQAKSLLAAPGTTSLAPDSWRAGMPYPRARPYTDAATGRAIRIAHLDQLSKPEAALLTLPLFHQGGQVGLIAAMVRGDTMHVVSPVDVGAILRCIEVERIERNASVPPLILSTIRHPDFGKYSMKSLTRLLTGAAPLGPDLQNEAMDRLGCPVSQVWGATETTGVATSASPFDVDPSTGRPVPGSCGKPVPGVEMRIVSVGGEEKDRKNLGPGKEGEIWIRGGIVTNGYLDNPKANAADFTPATKEELARMPEGKHWWRTGDIGYIREDHHLFIVDRLKELIKYKAFQVAPAELEDCVLSHAAVLDVAVIGVWDARQNTELPRAYVVRRPGAPGADAPDGELAQSIQQHVAKALVNYKHLRGGVRFVEAIPKGPSGKILRREIREQAKKEDAAAAKL